MSDDSFPCARSRWDLFCRVIDNYGDIGFCWRLARVLVEEYKVDVRLWVDQFENVQKLVPQLELNRLVQLIDGVTVCRWTDNFETPPMAETVPVADVVIEAFGCEIPPAYVQQMASQADRPVWINLEYLSAEPWVEECHRLQSVLSRSSLKKHFFFPGFTAKTGGLLCERGLREARFRFDRAQENQFLASRGLGARGDDEWLVSLFCYRNPGVAELLKLWVNGPRPIRLFVTPGGATNEVGMWLGRELTEGETVALGAVTIHALPFLSQGDYDQLLWTCDLNFVRGEDSFVRAQWAERPFVWQIYPQTAGADRVKLRAFLDRYLAGFAGRDAVSDFWMAWNGNGCVEEFWPEFAKIQDQLVSHGKGWASQLDQTGNLADNLTRFVQTAYGADGSLL